MRGSRIAGAVVLLLSLGGGATHAQLVINKVSLTDPQLVNGVLTATEGTVSGTLAGLPFSTDITNFSLNFNPAQAGACSVLDLSLAPIDLQLLGLHVDTSAICLNITAIPNGGLLGNLLCGLNGLDLAGILNGLLGNLPILGNTSLLSTILNQSLGGALGSSQRVGPNQAGGGGGSVCTGNCPILDLTLGPVDLTLLGLRVVLDNCDEGPVEVCVSATRSEGILGGLLCSLAGPHLPGLSLADITRLVNLAQQLLSDGALSNADIQVLRQLLRTLLNT